MNKQEIISVLAELYRITGFRVSLHGAQYEEIAAYPEGRLEFCKCVQSVIGEREKCIMCDKAACERALSSGETQIYKCRFGLTEAVSPLYNFGKLTGFLMMGQVVVSPDDSKRAGELLHAITGQKDCATLSEAIPIVDSYMLRSYVNIMTICARYLTLSNAIPSTKPTVAEQARRYIEENIGHKIVIGDICEELKCSKSTLLTTFKRKYGITVNNYITEVRLNMATKLLDGGKMTINEIAQEIGFSDQSYFSKVFSAKYGIPPSEYRLGETTIEQ